MNILALYTQKTLSLLRRVLGPYSVLAQRGYRFAFQSVPTFESGVSLAYGYDLTVLPNWNLSEEEVDLLRDVSRRRLFCYDLSDPALLQKETVREALACCRVVSVPNQFLAKEVKAAISYAHVRVVVLPSVIDVPYFMTAHTKARFQGEEGVPTIGCFGPHDWSLVQAPLQRLREKGGHFHVIGDYGAAHSLGELCEPVQMSFASYPSLLRRTLFGLCPREGHSGEETIWPFEYGILDRPCIASADSAYSSVCDRDGTRLVMSRDEDGWEMAIRLFLTDSRLRARYGHQAFCAANDRRSTQQIGPYYALVRKILPQVSALY